MTNDLIDAVALNGQVVPIKCVLYYAKLANSSLMLQFVSYPSVEEVPKLFSHCRQLKIHS